MFDLMVSEFKRFRLYAYACGALVFALLAYYASSQPFMANGTEVIGLNLFVVLASLGFGLTQMQLHKRKNNWAYLMHRPIGEHKLFQALALTGAGLMVIALIVPLFLNIVVNALLYADPLEARHWLFLAHMLLTALFCYFVGVFTILNPSWGAILSISLVFFVMANIPTSAGGILAIDATLVLLLGYLSKQSFKVNLNKHFERKRDLFLTTLVMHQTLAFLLFMSQAVFYHLPLLLVGEHPDSYSQEQLDGYFAQLWKLDNQERVELIVDEALFPDKATLKEQMALAKSETIGMNFEALPTRGQLFHQDTRYALEDKASKTRWLFSHNEMLFIGTHTKSKKQMGYLGPNQFFSAETRLDEIKQVDRFQQVPEIIENKFVRTYDTIYVIDFKERYIDIKHQVADGEYYYRSLANASELDVIAAISNKAVYLFNARNFQQDTSYAEADTVIPHHRDIPELYYLRFYELIDGYVISYESKAYYGAEQPGAAMVYAKFDGSHILLGEKRFKQYRPIPSAVSLQEYWTVPLSFAIGMRWLDNQLKSDLDPNKQTFEDLVSIELEPIIHQLALVTWLFCAILTWVLGKKQSLPKDRQLFWQGMIIVFGLAGFLSFLLLHRWRDRMPLKRNRKAEDHLPLSSTETKPA